MQQPALRSIDYIVLAAILALAIVLRLIGLNAPLWFDEIVTIQTYVNSPWNEVLQGYSMNNHFLFTLQSKFFASVFGDHIWAYRLPSVLFGIGTVLAIWWLARDVAGIKVAHVSALLIALSYHQVWFSQNARGYTELAFWSTMGMIFFLRGVRDPGRGVWIAYGIVLAAAVFTHLTGAFFFAAQGLIWLGLVIALAVKGRLPRDLVLSPLIGAAVGVLLLAMFYAPVVPDVLNTVGTVSETSAVDLMSEYQNPIWTVFEGVRTAIGGAGSLPLVVAACVIVMSCVGAGALHNHASLFALSVLAHIVLMVVLLSVLGMRIWPRFFFSDIGFVLILIVAGVSACAGYVGQLIGRPQLGPNLFIAVSVVMIAVSVVLIQRNYTAPKQDMAGSFALAEDIRSVDTRVYSVGHSGPVFTDYFGADWGNLMSQQDYDAVLSQSGSVVLVVPFPARSVRMIPTLKEDIGSVFQLVHRFPGTLGDGSILVLKRIGYD
ncbi:glycosyltransferase family 39 protein [Ruegeria sp.]|uniref:glycosyltransferase family 39 protein n=1 Tax=Ruegeria sp. TaxID=1879320 RepID=UPI003C7DCCAA